MIKSLLNRRNFLSNCSLFVASSLLFYLPSHLVRAAASPPPNDDLLNGIVPPDALAAAAAVTKSQIVHHHVAFIPKSILDNPPKGGWNTYTSRVMAELGFDPLLERVHKEHHFHQVDFSYDQILAIRESRSVLVDV